MMNLAESFFMSLQEFAEKLGTELEVEDGRCIFTVDGTLDVEIDYLDEVHVVVAWATVGVAPEDTFQAERARPLLALNELDAPNGGFSISMDPETRCVIAHDNRPAELFESGDRIAAWIGALVDLVNLIRHKFEEQFPCADLPLEDEADAEEV